MDKLRIIGKSNLKGGISVPGAKNSALPIMVSSLLSEEKLYLSNLPNLQDVSSMKQLLKNFGIKISKKKGCTIFDPTKIKNNIASYDLVRKMRASILVIGPLLSRFKEVKFSLPGGCAIGTRPIDIHLSGLKKLGVNFSNENGLIVGRVKKQLLGTKISLPFPSVGATENLMMAAVFAKGKTEIHNAAKEPEIVDLAKCLIKMGANIRGYGSSSIKIKGIEKLHQTKYKIISDRIVAGTFIIAAIMQNKKFHVKNIDHNLLTEPIKILKNMGANIKLKKNSIYIYPCKSLKHTKIETSPYPGFPTDLQAQIMALMSLADGNSQIKENIFENRFLHVPELNRLGAKIKIKNDKAYINGNRKFKGAQVMASDLRASVSLVLAGICAIGETTINRVYHIDRGYEKIEKNLRKCGIFINRIK